MFAMVREKVVKNHVLIVNSDKLAQKSLYEMLCRAGYNVAIAGSEKEAASHLDKNACRVALIDINGSGGTSLLETIRAKAYPVEVIIVASYGNIEAAVDNIKKGAFDYLVKPVEDNRIINTIERALAKKPQVYSRSISAKRVGGKDELFYDLVGKSDKMKDVYSVIERISGTNATVLLRGESGTGKRMVAQAIHKADPKRRKKPFVEICCGALPREIIESELFGHTKGAFTGAISDRKGRFEVADGGTVLLDDIDSFSLDLQVKLLRVLQDKEFERVGDHKTIKVDVHIIASTNQDLEKAVAEKRFREDLYYRLNVISLRLPALRERKEDLSLLINHFVDMYSKENHKNISGVSEDAFSTLTGYRWPGNIRELENIIERAVILDRDGVITKDDLPEPILNGSVAVKTEGDSPESILPASLKDALQEPEKVYILRILEEVGWNKKKAAVKLGVNRTTLYNKLHKYNLISYLDKV